MRSYRLKPTATDNRLRGLMEIQSGSSDVSGGRSSPRYDLLKLGWIEPAFSKGGLRVSETELNDMFGTEPGWLGDAFAMGWEWDGAVLTEAGQEVLKAHASRAVEGE